MLYDGRIEGKMKREGNKRKKWLGMLVGLMLLVFMVAYGYKEYASAAVSGTITASKYCSVSTPSKVTLYLFLLR